MREAARWSRCTLCISQEKGVSACVTVSANPTKQKAVPWAARVPMSVLKRILMWRDNLMQCVILHFTGMSCYFFPLWHTGTESEDFWIWDHLLVLRGEKNQHQPHYCLMKLSEERILNNVQKFGTARKRRASICLLLFFRLYLRLNVINQNNTAQHNFSSMHCVNP